MLSLLKQHHHNYFITFIYFRYNYFSNIYLFNSATLSLLKQHHHNYFSNIYLFNSTMLSLLKQHRYNYFSNIYSFNSALETFYKCLYRCRKYIYEKEI